MSSLWLFIHFPRLALESYFLSSDGSKPQLLLNPGSREVFQCNSLAERLGIKNGMSTSTAYFLLEDAEIGIYDTHIEYENLQRLALIGYRYSAHVSLASPDGLLLEVGTMLKLFNGLDNYWQQLQQSFQRAGFTAVYAVAHTARAAETLARNQISCCSTCADEVIDKLDTLTVFQLDIETRLAQRLTSMGIHHYQQLRRLPRSELGYRFGKTLVHYLNALEKDQTLQQSFIIPAHFRHQIDLLYEAASASHLRFPLKRLLQYLEQYLSARQLTAEQLFIKLIHRQRSPTILRIQAINGAWKYRDWQNLIGIQLERTRLSEPVIALQLRAHHFRPQKQTAGDLLKQHFPEQDKDQLLSILISRLGHEQVNTIRLTPDPRPQYASQLVSASMSAQFKKPEKYQQKLHYPVLLLNQPKPVNPQNYRLLSKPERIVTGRWLNGHHYRKDFFRAEIMATDHVHQIHWLSRRDDGNWFLEGVFA
ncbi:Y-family DNA polymerase [Gynuella sp.]|uniref:Y-family DNA polymerase n=1 Tax=Gynuella sp. TaxID=2969146 RepID=UPI003D099024